MRGYLVGLFENKFQLKFRNKGNPSNSIGRPEPINSNTTIHPETQQQS